MVAGLKRAGLRLAVLSNKPHVFTLEFVGHFFPEGTFEVVFGQRHGIGKKPDPAGALEIAGLLAVQPNECLYIGDTAVDMQTGKSAGMYTIGVLWGFRHRDELHAHHADMIVHHPMEIVDYAVATHRV
jgi:phosphoglycolate phosphatase